MSDRVSDYLLGELAADERARFEAELASDDALRAEVERLRPVLTRLGSLERAAWEQPAAEPPALAVGAPPAPPESVARRWWQRRLVLRPLPAAGLAALLLALGIAAGALLRGGEAGEVSGGRALALVPVEPLGGHASGSARLAASTGGGRATIHVSGLPPSERGSFYELWLLNSPDDLVALGSFRVPASGSVDVTVPLPADPRGFAALDVSIEPPDGDPGHSSRSVLRAPLGSSS